jgi:hypothetical protein
MKSALCKYYQPLRLEKPSNFRLDWPAPRWSQYISLLRQKGLVIETVLERHGGPYGGRRGRYILRSLIEIVDREDAA